MFSSMARTFSGVAVEAHSFAQMLQMKEDGALADIDLFVLLALLSVGWSFLGMGVARIFQRGGGGGSHCVKHYRHGVFATEYCRLFS